ASAQENKATCIGMSGLLVKSTVIMKENLDVLNQRDISLPVILGGAALTRRYVEEDCRRVYKGMLFYGADAFDDLKIMEALANGDDMQRFLGPPLTPCEVDEVESADKAETKVPEKTAVAAKVPAELAIAGRSSDSSHNNGNGTGKPKRSDVARGVEIPNPP